MADHSPQGRLGPGQQSAPPAFPVPPSPAPPAAAAVDAAAASDASLHEQQQQQEAQDNARSVDALLGEANQPRLRLARPVGQGKPSRLRAPSGVYRKSHYSRVAAAKATMAESQASADEYTKAVYRLKETADAAVAAADAAVAAATKQVEAATKQVEAADIAMKNLRC